jgi:hypothetical protein
LEGRAMKRYRALALPALVGLATLASFSGVTMCQAPDGEVQFKKFVLERFPILRGPGMPALTALKDETITQAFPSQRWFVVGFRQYPVTQIAPRPLRTRNLFAVSEAGQVRHITGIKELEQAFQSLLPSAKDEQAARRDVAAWLRLSEELKQDGFFKFLVLRDTLATTKLPSGRKASGKSVVTRGGNGEIRVALTFDDSGKLVSVSETSTVKAGVRPVCQASKLLDPDPIVRRMAEGDILTMGRDAKAYLDEERAKVSPELQRAIDRIWRRIEQEGW